MLDAIADSDRRYKGIAVVRNDATLDELRALKHQGIVGVAWNVTHYGVDYYGDAEPLLSKLVDLDMFVDIQVEHEQLLAMMPRLVGSASASLSTIVAVPRSTWLGSTGFRTLLELGATGRAFIKLSGFVKFSCKPAPHEDAWPFIAALVDAFTLHRCLWASDWPYLRAPARVDYGVVLGSSRRSFPIHPTAAYSYGTRRGDCSDSS